MLLLDTFVRDAGSAATVSSFLSFLMRSGFSTLTLAYVIDSLVRVSRRVGKSHFDRIARRPLMLRSGLSSGLLPRGDGSFLQTIPGAQHHSASCARINSNLPLLQRLLAYEVLHKRWAGQSTTKSYTNDISSTASFSTISSLLTLFSKFFSSFLRSTCSLSVSHKYLALEEVYLLFRAAIPNNPTLWKRSLVPRRSRLRGFHPLWRPVPRNLCFVQSPPTASIDYNSITLCHGFSLWAFACSLAATGAILVSFFSSTYWYA